MTAEHAPKIRIFRPGKYVSMEGVEVSFTADDLRKIADAYKADTDPAPLVIGHPKVDDPAWGWIDKLEVDASGALVGTPKDIEPSFAETVRAGRYRRVSARFFAPDAPSNPVPGVNYLKHVGFLGAQAPAVSGLGTVQFADDDDQSLTIIPDMENKMPESADENSFAERQSALDKREADLAKREADAKKAAEKARKDAAISFADGLVAAGKLKPAGKGLVVGVLSSLSDDTEISFAEGDDMTPANAFRKLFDGATPLISFGETAPADKRLSNEGGAISFAVPDGAAVDDGQSALYQKADAIQAENPKLSWMECVRRAQA